MRIGVDATCWANARGYGRFAREVMRALFARAPSDEFLCVGDRRAFAAWQPAAPNVRLVEVAQAVSPTQAAAADGNRSVGDMLALTRAVRREKPDVFFSPSVYTYFPLPLGTRAVVTVHDTIAERFPHLTLPSRRAQLFWAAKVRLALWQSTLVLTVSEHAARSIEAVLRVPRRRLRVCVEAPAPAYRPASPAGVAAAAATLGLQPGTPWFVYVGGFNPHKRVDLILRAHGAIAAGRQSAPHLVFIGTRSADVFHGEGGRLDDIIREAGTGHLVHWTGFLPDEAIVPLATGAVASLLPSEAEGFGLPAVEAAACGTPVIATTESPLPELLAGGGIFVSPGDLEGLTSAMRALLDDPARRASLGAMALARTKELTWERAADAVLAALYEAAGRSAPRLT